MSIIVKNRHFTASKNVYTADMNVGLGAIVRGLAIDNARVRIKAAALTAFTDSSTGTSSGSPYTMVDLPLPRTPFNATSAGGESLTSIRAALAAMEIAHAVLGHGFNLILGPAGLPLVLGVATGTGDVQAVGTVTFTVMPAAGDTVTVGGTVLTFSTVPADPTTGEEGSFETTSGYNLPAGHCGIGPDIPTSVQSLESLINGTPALNVMASTADGGAQLVLTAVAAGTAGNAITLVSSKSGNTASASTLAGGSADGTVALTIPAQTKAGTTASGTSTVEFKTGVAAMTVMKANHLKIVRAASSCLTALGEAPLVDTLEGSYPPDFMMNPLGEPVAGVTGASAIALADATAFYAPMANNIATLAATYAAVLTDIAANTMPLHVVAG